MEGIYYILAAAIFCLLYIIWHYLTRIKNGFIFPSTIFMMMWALACITFFIGQVLNVDEFSKEYDIAGPYIFYFIITSLLGFIGAKGFAPKQRIRFRFNYAIITYIANKLKLFLYLSFIFGLLRIFLIIRIFGFTSLLDYRKNNFLVHTLSDNGIFNLVNQISSYLYVCAAFCVVFYAIKHALSSINSKETLWILFLFSAQSISIGGRTFIIEFMSCYFMMFFLVRTHKKIILKKKEVKIIILIFFSLIALIGSLGLLRSGDTVTNEKSEYLTKYLYARDGIIYTSALFHYLPEGPKELDYGVNTIDIGSKDSNFVNFRESGNMALYKPFVTGILAPLVFDFGIIGALIVWFIICFISESISINILNKGTIWRFLIFFAIIRYFYDTPILIIGGRGFLRYLFIILVLFVFRKTLLPALYTLNYKRIALMNSLKKNKI